MGGLSSLSFFGISYLLIVATSNRQCGDQLNYKKRKFMLDSIHELFLINLFMKYRNFVISLNKFTFLILFQNLWYYFISSVVYTPTDICLYVCNENSMALNNQIIQPLIWYLISLLVWLLLVCLNSFLIIFFFRGLMYKLIFY